MLTYILLKAWLLVLLVTTGDPNAPWKDTYESTAAAFAESAIASPLFCTKQPNGGCTPQADDIKRTGALYVATSWFESRHNPKAKGDGACLSWDEHADVLGKPRCLKRGPPQSLCLGQIGISNFPGLGITEDVILSDVKVCVNAMNTLMRKSFKVCAGQPTEFLLSQYATGGGTCTPVKESQHRMKKAQWLFRNIPFEPGAKTASN